MTENPLNRLTARLGYEFKDVHLLKKALTHRSASASNNERLEFLGDAVLDLLIAEALYIRFPHATEGELTRLRSSLVKGKTLSKVAHELDLGCCLSLGTGEIKTGGQHRESILADAVEAILGAIYLESGIDACRERILSWFQSRLEAISLDVDEKDAKTRLQEWLQSRGKPLPVYEVIASQGEPHDQILTVSCVVPGLPDAVIAQSSNRKKAEKKAAQLALLKLLDGKNA
ncbi:MAG: ribonuclease III [Porticoccaceae bacterium]|nr:ribonuclease III [Porticoccaceae bacterium]